MTGNRKLRAQGIKLTAKPKPVLYINPVEHENLMNFLISVKGSSIPNFASAKIVDSGISEILGNDVVVSQNATTDYAVQFMPKTSVVWKQFMPLKSVVINEPLIGKKIRVAESGEALLVYPKSVHILTDTVV